MVQEIDSQHPPTAVQSAPHPHLTPNIPLPRAIVLRIRIPVRAEITADIYFVVLQ
jgi:hypothetical protein